MPHHLRFPGGHRAGPLAELLILFAVCFVPSPASLLTRDVSSLDSPPAHLLAAIGFGARALLLVHLLGSGTGGSSGPGGIRLVPRYRDLAEGLLIAAVLVIAGFATAALSTAAGWTNPLFRLRAEGAHSPFLLIPAAILSALAVGYAEELFFRVYAFGRLLEAGLGNGTAALAACLVFAAAHSGQGVPGVLTGLASGAILQALWISRKNLPALALGHAVYDLGVLVLSLSLRTTG